MAVTFRGGRPFVRTLTVSTAGAIGLADVADSEQAPDKPYTLPAQTAELQITNREGGDVKVYFTEEDYTADVNALVVPNGETRDARLKVRKLWMKAVIEAAEVELLGAASH